jgi:hypothetical protein
MSTTWAKIATVLYMVIERIKPGSAEDVYRRFRDHGRLSPVGLEYVASWVADDYSRCYQVMQTDQPTLLEEWMRHWRDLIDFEIMTVRTSADAAAAIAPRL